MTNDVLTVLARFASQEESKGRKNKKTYFFGSFDANNVDSIVHEIDQFGLQRMTGSIVEDTEAISVNVFIFIGLGKHEAGQPSKAAWAYVHAQETRDEEYTHHQNDHQAEDHPFQTRATVTAPQILVIHFVHCHWNTRHGIVINYT